MNVNVARMLVFCYVVLVAVAAQGQTRVVVVPMGGAPGDAVAADVVEGKTFSSKAGKGLTGTRSPGVLGKTGQTLCYDPACTVAPCNPVACASTAEDGESQTGVAVSPRFTDNDDGTVTDNLTGLIWLREGNCTAFFASDGIGHNDRPWQAALAAAQQLASGYCGLTDGSVAGDWRLPNLRELLSLIDFSQISPALPAGHPFLNTVSSLPSYYWSSTTVAGYTYGAWLVDFSLGVVSNDFKSSGSNYVRAVRGGQ